MGKHEAQRSVRGHSRGHNLCRPQARPSGSGRREHAREARQTPFFLSQAPARHDRTHARVRPSPPPRRNTHTRARARGGLGTRGARLAKVSPPPATATPWEDDRDEAAPVPPPREGNRGTPPLTISTPPPKRATHGTHHRGGDPRSTLGKGNDTTARPRAPEGRPGALQEHHRGPSKARSRAGRGAQRSGGTAPPPPTRGGPPAGATRQGGEARVSAASEDRGPAAHALRQGAGGRGSGPETTTPALPHTPRQAGRA